MDKVSFTQNCAISNAGNEPLPKKEHQENKEFTTVMSPQISVCSELSGEGTGSIRQWLLKVECVCPWGSMLFPGMTDVILREHISDPQLPDLFF